MIRPTIAALAVLALAAPASAAAHGDERDAEIFATNNTATITDPDDPRLRDELAGFGRDVERIIEQGGGGVARVAAARRRLLLLLRPRHHDVRTLARVRRRRRGR